MVLPKPGSRVEFQQTAVEGFILLTRGPRRYRTYFPSVALIAPA